MEDRLYENCGGLGQRLGRSRTRPQGTKYLGWLTVLDPSDQLCLRSATLVMKT